MNEITSDELDKLDLENVLLVDLRATKEYRKGTILNAISIPLDDISKKLYSLPHDKLICVFCDTGDWSLQVIELLKDLGYDAVHLVGGYSAYVNQFRNSIYLDYSANTPVDKHVLDLYYDTAMRYYGNPNSNHYLGRLAYTQLNQSIKNIADTLSIQPNEIIFTSGATESNNLAIKGIAKISCHIGRHIISTNLEHSSVSNTLAYLQTLGYKVDIVRITENGTIDLFHLKELLSQDTILLCICNVDSELGIIQPIDRIVDILEEFPNCKLHVDCTQAIGKIPFSFSGIDTASFTAHKFYGLNGCGILYKRNNIILEPIIHGGKSTTIYRAGTPDTAMVVAMDIALNLSISNLEKRYRRVSTVYNSLVKVLSEYPLVKINSTDKSVPHILNLSVKGIKSSTFQRALDSYGVCVSTKSACSQTDTISKSVYELTNDKKNALSSWRVSISHITTNDEVTRFLSAFEKCYYYLTK